MDYDHILPKNDFAFGKIMEDKETCKRFIEQALNIKIRDLVYLEKQKTLDPAIDVKGIRLDVFVEGDQNTVYNIEMQSANRGELPKRSRYYQGVMDVESLNRGGNYKDLPKCFVIFVCSFDPFGKRHMKYTFTNQCKEVSNLPLDDGATKIFLNTKGKIYNVSRELQDTLRYLEEPIIREDSLLLARMVDAQYRNAMSDQKWRQNVKAMEIRYNELLEEGRKEGRAEGRAEGRKEGLEEGLAEGRAEGEINGTLKTLAGLVNDKILSAAEAAKRAGVTEEEIRKML